jgi:uncharacterized alkaline shock family protein YloU
MNRPSEKKLGSIRVSPTAIATIASNAVLTCYGVVGMASKNTFNELAATLTRDPHHGIEVRHERGKLAIDAYIIVQHGTRISTVADSVINAIRFNVEQAVGIPVNQVNVFVQGLRLIDEPGDKD